MKLIFILFYFFYYSVQLGASRDPLYVPTAKEILASKIEFTNGKIINFLEMRNYEGCPGVSGLQLMQLMNQFNIVWYGFRNYNSKLRTVNDGKFFSKSNVSNY
jgi:hypothetical protein